MKVAFEKSIATFFCDGSFGIELYLIVIDFLQSVLTDC